MIEDGAQTPQDDPARWLDQVTGVCRGLRDQYLTYPGIARASFDTTPRNLQAWRLYEGMLAILVAAGVPVPAAAGAVDAAFLYVGAYSIVARRRSAGDDSAAGMADRFRRLPPGHFPLLSAHADEITGGQDRFGDTLDLLFGGLAARKGASS